MQLIAHFAAFLVAIGPRQMVFGPIVVGPRRRRSSFVPPWHHDFQSGQLELAIVEYVGWFNTARLHQALGDLPPAEFEDLHAPRSMALTTTTMI